MDVDFCFRLKGAARRLMADEPVSAPRRLPLQPRSVMIASSAREQPPWNYLYRFWLLRLPEGFDLLLLLF